MACAIDVLDNLIREELPAVVHESLTEIAPVYKYIKRTSLGVQRSGIGRDWEVLHLFGTGVAGLMYNADPRGPANYDSSGYPQSRVLDYSTAGNLTPFPPAAEAPHQFTLRRSLTLHKSTGNFSIPITWISADALQASQVEQVVRDIKAVGDLRAQTEAVSFFMGDANSLCRMSDVDLTDIADGTIRFRVAFGTGRTSFFRVGMMVDLYLDDDGHPSGAKQNILTATYHPLIVADVDYLYGLITLQDIRGRDMSAMVAADGWHVVLRGNSIAREMRSWGLEDWIQSSGTILGGAAGAPCLDLDVYSQFKSLVASINGPLTDIVMNRYVGGFLDAYVGNTLDTIVTTMGVTIRHLEQPLTRGGGTGPEVLFYDRTGKALNVHGGWDDIGYSFNGRKFNWLISPLCINGRLYVTKFNGGNVRRYMPPRVGGLDTRVGDEVEFLAPLAGSSNVFLPGRGADGQVQELIEAPFWQYILVCPMDVRSVKLTDLTEADIGEEGGSLTESTSESSSSESSSEGAQ